jgi:pimeloyl-ACP methyl ester carboxylesterase
LTSTATLTAGTLAIPGGQLYYETRGRGPLIVLIGAPMDASSFAPLADLLAADHTVLTTDPRGVNRSRLDEPDRDSTPELRADDLSRLITHLGAGPAVVVGSSGGAVSALALVQAHPEQVSTVVAHEPPLESLLEDHEQRRIAADDVVATFLAEGSAAAWGKFMANANITMPGDDDAESVDGSPSESTPPENATVENAGVENAGLENARVENATVDTTGWNGTDPGDLPWTDAEPDPQAAATEYHFFVHEMRASTNWQPDLGLLRTASTRIVIGIGVDSTGETCDLTSRALTAALGIEPTMFPGGHIAFVDDPAVFATRLRQVLQG